MRAFTSFLAGILIAALVAALGILVVQNPQPQRLLFLNLSLQGNTGWVLATAAALGFALAVLLLLPGQLASLSQRWSQSRQEQLVAEQLRALREELAQLHGSHQRLLLEHQQVMDKVLSPRTVGRKEAVSIPVGTASTLIIGNRQQETSANEQHTNPTSPTPTPSPTPSAV